MDDKAIVAEAYEKVIEQVFTTFFTSYTAAQSNASEEAAAEQRFRAGVVHARHVRDRALALLP